MPNKAVTRKYLADCWVIKVSTSKVSSHLETRSSVMKLSDGFETHRLFKDFNRLLISDICPRVSQKLVDEQHAKVDWQGLEEAVRVFYIELGEKII